MSHKPVEPDSPARSRRPPQFRLSTLFWFVAAWGAFFSQLASVAGVGAHKPDWRDVLIFVPGWVILAAFYLRVDLRSVAVVHFLGVAALLTVLLVIAPNLLADGGWATFAAAACLSSSVITFPAAVISLLVAAFRRQN